MYKKLCLLLAIALCLSLALCACAASRPEDAAPADTTPATTPMPEAYDQILQNLINAYPWNDDENTIVPENPELSYMYRQKENLSEVGYALVDLDQDGQAELLLGDYAFPFVFDIYTIVDGQLVHILDSGERYGYYPLENGYIEHVWSGGAALSGHDYFRLENGKLVFMERLTMDADHALDIGLIKELTEATDGNTCFRSKTDQTEDYQLISFDEYLAAIDAWQSLHKQLVINYTPLSEYGK